MSICTHMCIIIYIYIHMTYFSTTSLYPVPSCFAPGTADRCRRAQQRVAAQCHSSMRWSCQDSGIKHEIPSGKPWTIMENVHL